MPRLTQIDGLPVIDAKSVLRLTVTKGDIHRARRNMQEPAQCAVARACYRALQVHEARVHLSRIYLRLNDSNWTRYQTPSAMRDEIIAFDRGGQFEPGQFELRPVPVNDRLGAPRRGGKSTGKGKKRKRPNVLRNVRGGPA